MDIAQNVKNEIIQKGAEIIHHKGYSAAGLNEILQRAGVPKGSFYYYFKSKEHFGLEVIDYFAGVIEGIFNKYLADDSAPPLLRLSNLLDFYGRLLAKQGYALGCPIGNLSLEMADTNERFRERLDSSIGRLVGLIEESIVAAQKEMSVSAEIDAAEAARFIFYGFEGALLHVKVLKSITPLQTFKECIFSYLTKQIPVKPKQKKTAIRGQ